MNNKVIMNLFGVYKDNYKDKSTESNMQIYEYSKIEHFIRIPESIYLLILDVYIKRYEFSKIYRI